VLLSILFVFAWFFELGKSTRVVVDGPLRLSPLPASRLALADEALVDKAIQLTPAFVVDEPTTLSVTLRRGPEEGWVGADLALIDEESGQIRTLRIATDVRAAVGADLDEQRSATVLIDRVTPGRYVLRIAPSWEPLEDPAPGRMVAAAPTATASAEAPAEPPTAHIEVVEGRRSHLALALSALFILVPPLFATGWRALRRRPNGRMG
jgi:hypothetical protein